LERSVYCPIEIDFLKKLFIKLSISSDTVPSLKRVLTEILVGTSWKGVLSEILVGTSSKGVLSEILVGTSWKGVLTVL